MPYDSNDQLPEAVQEIPDEFQTIWREAYNAGYERAEDESPGEREGRAAATGWAAVRRAGFDKDNMKKAKHPCFYHVESTKLFRGVPSKDGVLFKGATLFKEGEWTDSAVGMAVEYTRDELAKSAHLWKGQEIWNNHVYDEQGFLDRKPTDHLGTIVKSYMVGGELKGDLLMHGHNQASKDAIEMWNNKIMPELSVEMGSTDVPRGNNLMATNIAPLGVAWVTKGAVKGAQVAMQASGISAKVFQFTNNQNKGGVSQMADDSDEDKNPFEEEVLKLKSQLKALQEENEELKKEMKKAQAPLKEKGLSDDKALQDTVAEMEKAMSEKDETFKALQAKIETLEKIEVQFSQSPDGGDNEDTTLPPKMFNKSGRGDLEYVGNKVF